MTDRGTGTTRDNEQPSSVCPNCGRPLATHAMFNPPRCPVVRLRFPDDAIVSYSEITPLCVEKGA